MRYITKHGRSLWAAHHISVEQYMNQRRTDYIALLADRVTVNCTQVTLRLGISKAEGVERNVSPVHAAVVSWPDFL